MSEREFERRMAIRDMLISRRAVLRGAMGLSMAAFLAACGGGDDDDDDAGSDEPTPATDTESADPTATQVETSESGTRTFEHALGTAEIPSQPERVAVLNIIALDSALLTGVTPVAAVLGRETPWRDDVDAIETQLEFEVDTELLLSESPDLIFDGAFDGRLFSGIEPAILEEIAPVVAFDFENDLQWPEYFLFYADALNRL